MAAPLQYSLLLLPFLCLFLALAFSSDEADPKVPAIFIFGDSSVDVGNNKYLPEGKYNCNNFLPYGIDYPSTNDRNPTGRFSNGYNGADILAQYMGFNESPPPFLSLVIDQITYRIKNMTQAENGINFASGGSTLLWESSPGVISMTDQMVYFRNFWLQLHQTMSSQQIYQLLSKSLFFISIGDNDIGAYLGDNKTDIQSFISNLTATYGNHLKDLYKLGGRKFGIVNFVPIGNIPKVKAAVKAAFPSDPLIRDIILYLLNAVAAKCNHELETLLKNLSSTLPGMKYSIGNSNAVFMKIFKNPGAFGFKNVTDPCYVSAKDGCNANSTICPDRSQYLFWDDVHPTEATARVFGDLVYNGSTEYASPINFKELAEDDKDLISVY